MSRRPQELVELYQLREKLREQLRSGTGDKLELRRAIVELAERINAMEGEPNDP
jgi:hypothetical protein